MVRLTVEEVQLAIRAMLADVGLAEVLTAVAAEVVDFDVSDAICTIVNCLEAEAEEE